MPLSWVLKKRYGGTLIYIPKLRGTALGLTEDETARLRRELKYWLKDKEGEDNEDRRVWLPKADAFVKLARNRALRGEREQYSISQLARRYDLSSRHIINICKGAEPPDPNLSLF
jgi:Mor family transcriptional regulator